SANNRGWPLADVFRGPRGARRASRALARLLRGAPHAEAPVVAPRGARRKPRAGSGGSMNVDILILGAGPTGLGAAWRLDTLGARDWHLCEAAPAAGGLAGSVVDDHGFTWDLGG